MSDSDPLLAFANGSASLLIPTEITDRIEEIRLIDGDSVALPLIWKVDDYFYDEWLAIARFFADANLEPDISRRPILHYRPVI